MIKRIFVVFCGAILCKQALSVLYPGEKELPLKRKASLFLQNKAIPGLGDMLSPEDIAPQANDYLIPDMTFVDPALRAAVLEGNYPESKLKIIKHKMPPLKPILQIEDNTAGGQPVGKQMLNKKIILMDPLEELLLRKINATNNSTGNGTAPEGGVAPEEIDEADLEQKSVTDGLKKFVKRLLECKAKLIFCKQKNMISCYLYCLLGNHAVGQLVKSNVNSLVKSLCEPLGTVFDVGVKLFNKNIAKIKTIKNFLTLLKIIPETFKRFTRLAANAIPAILLKYSNVYGADYFKTVISGLATDTKAADSTTDISKELSNPACATLDIFSAVQRIVGLLYKNPKLINIFLPGLWTISKIFKLVSVPLITSGLKAFGGALSILVGLNCGLLHFITSGKNTTCEDEEHVLWEATEQELLQPESGVPVVCGAVPYIPPRIVLDDLFPPIFNLHTTTTKSSNNDSSTSNDHVNGTATLNRLKSAVAKITGMDDVGKTLDTDGE